jgi:sulfide:quinone oxidoreductase
MGHDDVNVTVVTPERQPLSLFGEEAARALADELRWAGVDVITGVVARGGHDGVRLEPGGDRLDVQRVFAVPRLVGPALEGLAADEEGFVVCGDDGRVEGTERIWAAGDGIVSPVKFGGLATHQARVATAEIARLAGVEDVPDPGEPVLHGRLLTGRRSRRLRGRGDAEGAPLWWPHGKVAGEYLPRWLAENGVAPPASEPPPDGEGVTVKRPLHALRGPEYQYLFELGRQYRIADPAIASLGRRMRETRSR